MSSGAQTPCRFTLSLLTDSRSSLVHCLLLSQDDLYLVFEKQPMRVFRLSRTTGSFFFPFDAEAVLGPYITDLAGLHFVSRTRTLLVLSQESKKIVQITPEGRVVGAPMSVEAARQPEGVALSQDEETLYIIGEPNELHVYEKRTNR